VKGYTQRADSRTLDSLITLGTPQRGDYELNLQQVASTYINVYSNNDMVQQNGGALTRGGIAGRTDPQARNVEASRVTVEYVSRSGRSVMETRTVPHSGAYSIRSTTVFEQHVAPILASRGNHR